MAVVRISALATRSNHTRLAVADAALLRLKAGHAAANPRLREIHCFHHADAALLQRMLNAMQPGSYGRPHRRLAPAKDEGFVLLQGRAGVAVFEDDGSLLPESLVLLDRERGALAADVRAGTWHTVLALAPDTVLYEVKNGPYAAIDDKDFAPRAPAPDTAAARAYLADLEQRFYARFGLPD